MLAWGERLSLFTSGSSLILLRKFASGSFLDRELLATLSPAFNVDKMFGVLGSLEEGKASCVPLDCELWFDAQTFGYHSMSIGVQSRPTSARYSAKAGGAQRSVAP